MRILHTESSMGMGGEEYRVLMEAKGMEGRGHVVTIAAPKGSQLADHAKEQGLKVKLVASGNPAWMTLIPSYYRMINQCEIDVVNTHGSQDSWTASIAGRISSRRPVIIRTRHKSTPVSPSIRHRLAYETLPHVVTTTGEAVRRELISRNHLTPSRVISIPTGVDLTRFQPRPPDEALRRTLGLKREGPLVGTVTFLRPEKGMDILIESVKILKKSIPSIQCLIVGEGQEKLTLLTRIRELGLQNSVHLAGFRRDIEALLALLDVVVIPSFEEGIPQSLTQALAMERPVVASAVGGIPEVIEDGVTGLLVPPRSPVPLSEKIDFLLKHPSEGVRMGQVGRKIIHEQYSLDHMLDQTEDVYRRVFQSVHSLSLNL